MRSGVPAVWIAKWAGAFLVSLWVSIPAAIQTLLVLMSVDYMTGVLSAYIVGTLSSREGLRGLARKTAMLLLVVTAHSVIGPVVSPLHLPLDFGSTVVMAFCANELISIAENCNRAGVPIPSALLEVLSRAKKVTGRKVRAKGAGE